MLTTRSAALAALVIGSSGAPALAATCNLTVIGAPVIDDATCTVAVGRGGTTTVAAIEGGSTVLIRHMIMSVRLAGDPSLTRRRARSFGRVVPSDAADDKTCYFNQKAVFCVEQ